MYDIDVMWHTHIVYPKAYTKDMTKILGYVMTHDDTIQEREEGSLLNTVFIFYIYILLYTLVHTFYFHSAVNLTRM